MNKNSSKRLLSLAILSSVFTLTSCQGNSGSSQLLSSSGPSSLSESSSVTSLSSSSNLSSELPSSTSEVSLPSSSSEAPNYSNSLTIEGENASLSGVSSSSGNPDFSYSNNVFTVDEEDTDWPLSNNACLKSIKHAGNTIEFDFTASESSSALITITAANHLTHTKTTATFDTVTFDTLYSLAINKAAVEDAASFGEESNPAPIDSYIYIHMMTTAVMVDLAEGNNAFVLTCTGESTNLDCINIQSNAVLSDTTVATLSAE